MSRDQRELTEQPLAPAPRGHPGHLSAPHHVGEVRPCVEFLGLLAGGDIRQLLQAEELWDINDVLLHQAQLPLQDVTVQVNAFLQGGQQRMESIGHGEEWPEAAPIFPSLTACRSPVCMPAL